MTSHRFFRASPEQYEAARVVVDALLGLPSGRAETAFAPIADAVRDAEGRCYVAIRAAALAENAALEAAIFQHAEEITEAEYFAALPSSDE